MRFPLLISSGFCGIAGVSAGVLVRHQKCRWMLFLQHLPSPNVGRHSATPVYGTPRIHSGDVSGCMNGVISALRPPLLRLIGRYVPFGGWCQLGPTFLKTPEGRSQYTVK